jgi:RNA-binding protein
MKEIKKGIIHLAGKEDTRKLGFEIANALEARELIKARVLENSGYTAKEAAAEIASVIECDVVSCVGTKFVLYKESVKKKRIEL